MVNIFCQDCQSLGCLLCADQQNTHQGHQVLTLPQAADYFKVSLHQHLLLLLLFVVADDDDGGGGVRAKTSKSKPCHRQ